MAYRIEKVQLCNFGPIRSFTCDQFAPINLIIGEQRTGKSHLLKAMYATLRAMEEYKRGDNTSSLDSILAERLRWTFQTDQLGDIVSKSGDVLSLDLTAGSDTVQYQFTATATRKVAKTIAPETNKAGHSAFIPPHEVLSAQSSILDSRQTDAAFAYDDPAYDLAKLIDLSPPQMGDSPAVAPLCKKLRDIIGGRIRYDRKKERWVFKNRENQTFALGSTSAAMKKIGTLEILLSSGLLNEDSVLFCDDLDATLHPDDIYELLEVMAQLTRTTGMQVFLTSGSYILLNKLRVIARGEAGLVKYICLYKDREPDLCDLHDGEMPKNPITDASVRVYEDELDFAFP